MLRQLSIFIILFLIISCEKDSEKLTQDSALESIAGTWYLSEKETGSYGQKYWTDAQASQKDHRIILNDGSILDLDSLVVCCPPSALVINKSYVELAKNGQFAANPMCALVSCETCPSWELTWTGHTMVITYCNGTRLKYVKR